MLQGHPLAYRSIDPESDSMLPLSRRLSSTRGPASYLRSCLHHPDESLRTMFSRENARENSFSWTETKKNTLELRFLACTGEPNERGTTKRFAAVRGRCSTARMHIADSTCSGILVCPHHHRRPRRRPGVSRRWFIRGGAATWGDRRILI